MEILAEIICSLSLPKIVKFAILFEISMIFFTDRYYIIYLEVFFSLLSFHMFAIWYIFEGLSISLA